MIARLLPGARAVAFAVGFVSLYPTKGGRIITVAVHTKKEVGTGLALRILKEAGS